MTFSWSTDTFYRSLTSADKALLKLMAQVVQIWQRRRGRLCGGTSGAAVKSEPSADAVVAQPHPQLWIFLTCYLTARPLKQSVPAATSKTCVRFIHSLSATAETRVRRASLTTVNLFESSSAFPNVTGTGFIATMSYSPTFRRLTRFSRARPYFTLCTIIKTS